MSNTFSFIGTLGQDATINTLPSGAPVINCNVANNIGFGDNKKTQWFSVAVFGKRAEGSLVGYLRKGQMVFVSGEFYARPWSDNDGVMRLSLDINANILDLVGKKTHAQQSQNRPPEAPPYDDVPD